LIIKGNNKKGKRTQAKKRGTSLVRKLYSDQLPPTIGVLWPDKLRFTARTWHQEGFAAVINKSHNFKVNSFFTPMGPDITDAPEYYQAMALNYNYYAVIAATSKAVWQINSVNTVSGLEFNAGPSLGVTWVDGRPAHQMAGSITKYGEPQISGKPTVLTIHTDFTKETGYTTPGQPMAWGFASAMGAQPPIYFYHFHGFANVNGVNTTGTIYWEVLQDVIVSGPSLLSAALEEEKIEDVPLIVQTPQVPVRKAGLR
jgi:hypothetical protein